MDGAEKTCGGEQSGGLECPRQSASFHTPSFPMEGVTGEGKWMEASSPPHAGLSPSPPLRHVPLSARLEPCKVGQLWWLLCAAVDAKRCVGSSPSMLGKTLANKRVIIDMTREPKLRHTKPSIVPCVCLRRCRIAGWRRGEAGKGVIRERHVDLGMRGSLLLRFWVRPGLEAENPCVNPGRSVSSGLASSIQEVPSRHRCCLPLPIHSRVC